MTTSNVSLKLDCLYQEPLARAEADTMRYLGRLLNSPPRLLTPDELQAASDAAEPPDLLLYWEPERPRWQRWFGICPALRLVENAPSSVLIMRQAHKLRSWSLKRILLILRAHPSDGTAIEWVQRLATAAHADVYVLPIIPPIPAMYRYGQIPLQVEVVLSPNTYSGAQLRRLVGLCQQWGVHGELLLKDSEPDRRMAWAADSSQCDLIIISEEPYPWLHRRFLGELVRPLLRHVHRPILIAREQASPHG
ncbi:MAG: universal stress protein [Anaerolineaceae bacterium]|nr:universal stress protein [Anaerolineaceae bacterium]